MSNPTIALLGEAMLELSAQESGFRLGQSSRLGYGGDTLNTGIYLSRLGISTRYLTALGEDPFSVEMLRRWKEEKLITDCVLTHPTRLTGIYAIETDDEGERTFYYWRENSAARAIFSLPDIETALDKASKSDLFFVSGITLSLYSETDRARIHDLARKVKRNGGAVAFDPNYRARLWPDQDAAANAFLEFAAECDFVLPSCTDEDELFGKASPEQHVKRWLEAGSPVVVMKDGPRGSVVYSDSGDRIAVPACPASLVKDTTGAGDSFNAGFLAGLVRSMPLEDCAHMGSRLASLVISHSGAIAPHAVTSPLADQILASSHAAVRAD